MSDWAIYGIGLIAQLLFSGRTVYQWLSSEKAKKVVAPRFFWQMSLFASFLLFVYGYLRLDIAIMLGQSLNYFIYIRNIQLEGHWFKFPLLSRIFLLIFPALVVLYYYNNNRFDISLLFDTDNIALWLMIFGIAAQVIFNFRFIYQWIYSERNRKSALPKFFWMISLGGAILILVYGIFRKDPILILGHSFGIFVYLRNLKLIKFNNDQLP